LDDNLFANRKKRQENINVDIVVSQVANVDLRGAGLRGIVPKKIAVIWIARSSKRIGKIQEQA
jgi:hypothetical protein